MHTSGIPAGCMSRCALLAALASSAAQDCSISFSCCAESAYRFRHQRQTGGPEAARGCTEESQKYAAHLLLCMSKLAMQLAGACNCARCKTVTSQHTSSLRPCLHRGVKPTRRSVAWRRPFAVEDVVLVTSAWTALAKWLIHHQLACKQRTRSALL